MSAAPVSRTRTLWVPSLGTACGIAEYTTHLAAHSSSVRMTGTEPDIESLGLLHVQHEYALFDDAGLSAYFLSVRERGLPIVVTEHSVIIAERPRGPVVDPWDRILFTAMRDWELAADALVSLTPIGADILRRRFPEKRIVHIPHGCPTWFPKRKGRRERVIGAFGFLHPYKGFWNLLDVLREVPGTELVIYSHPKDIKFEPEWIRASEGLPVRWIREFLPVEEIAARLAREADILAFWYRAGSLASSSGAVRIGLATGVPVLTSPIGTFQDVRGATYQPQDLIAGIRRLLDDTALRTDVTEGAREYCHANDWFNSGQLHLDLWRQLESAA